MTEVAADFQRETGIGVRLNFAASSVLARQIVSGAETDLFISADLRWMDYLQASQLLQKRAVLTSNQMVLICHPDLEVIRSASEEIDMEAVLKETMVLGDPHHVPAGAYAKQILEKQGWWSMIAGKMVAAHNVREALLLVERGEVKLGMVYVTDAMASKKVKILRRFEFPHSPGIHYPVALLNGGNGNADHFFRYLFSEPAQAVFRRHGFLTGGNNAIGNLL